MFPKVRAAIYPFWNDVFDCYFATIGSTYIYNTYTINLGFAVMLPRAQNSKQDQPQKDEQVMDYRDSI